MTHLRKRLDRLAAKRGMNVPEGPSVIYLTSPGREARLALLVGSGTVSRLKGESEAAFMERAEKAASTNAHRVYN